MIKKLHKNVTQSLLIFGSGLLLYKYHSYVGTVVYCEGISMEPTVNNGDYLLVERLSVIMGKVKKGDIVVAGQPRHSSSLSHVLKRIKGLGEDQITFWDTSKWITVMQEVPRDYVWLEGDNSLHSLDSRTYGPIHISQLEYRVLLRIWPLKRFGSLQYSSSPVNVDVESQQTSLTSNNHTQERTDL